MQSYREFYEQSRRRKRQRTTRRVLAVAVILLLIFGAAGIVVKLTGGKDEKAPAGSLPGDAISAENLDAEDGDEVLAPLPNMDGNGNNATIWNTMGPVEQTLDYEIRTPDFRMIALPECGVVDASYFDTATFVGDSLTQGLQLYSTGLPNAHYCAYKSIGPKHIVDGSVVTRADKGEEIAMDALRDSQPDYVYVLLGTNTLVNPANEEGFLAYYEKMLDMFREHLLEGVKIYVQSIPPVRPEVVQEKAGLENNRIRQVNNQLAQMALEKGLYFVDLQECLADEEGNLREDYAAADGIHLNPDGYQAWVDYLARHTAYDKRNPYLYGSPYYIPGE